jgi:hypothetical protein
MAAPASAGAASPSPTLERLTTSGRIQIKNEGFVRAKYIIQNVIKGLKTGYEIAEAAKETVDTTIFSAIETVPRNLPTGGWRF